MADKNVIDHRVTGRQRWDAIAWQYYGDASLAWLILAANRHLADHLGQMPPVPPDGAVVRVPVIDRKEYAPGMEAPPWL